MSKYTMYYNERQEMYRDFAINWVNATASMNLTERQRRGMALFFLPIAKRFGLTQEFKELGII